MIYNIITLADIHWGVIDANEQYKHLNQVITFLEYSKDMIDMVVICGDYYDSKLPLNSSAAILSVQWMHDLINTSKKYGVKKIRVFKGTEDHDNNQLDIFKKLEDSSGFFKLFNINTYEETLPELKCIYCPDENINAVDYFGQYLDNITQDINIGFFHGSFDVVSPDIVVQNIHNNRLATIMYEYSVWKKIVNGPLISGHWHDASITDDLIYIGSFERWQFNEYQEKGFGFISYDTETYEYLYEKIPNLYAPMYITVDIDTTLYKSIEDYNNAIQYIDNLLKEHDTIHVRILITITDSKPDNTAFISSIKDYYIGCKPVKIIIKNMIKEVKKKSEKDKHQQTSSMYSFILNKKNRKAQIIQEFILKSKNIELSVEDISQVIGKYIKDE